MADLNTNFSVVLPLTKSKPTQPLNGFNKSSVNVNTASIRTRSAAPNAVNTLLLREPLDMVECKRKWLAAVADATALFLKLPPAEIGCLYLNAQGQAVTPDPAAPEFPQLRRHFGCVSGAWPTIAAS